LATDEVLVVADSRGHVAITAAGLLDESLMNTRFVRWGEMGNLTISASDTYVEIEGKRVHNPFFRAEKQQRYARALFALRQQMRDSRPGVIERSLQPV
jgi:hypothetical protein